MPPLERRRRRRSAWRPRWSSVLVVVGRPRPPDRRRHASRPGLGPVLDGLGRPVVRGPGGDADPTSPNETGAQLRDARGWHAALTRPALQQQLDSLVDRQLAARRPTSWRRPAPPTPSGHLGQDFAGVLADRAEAATEPPRGRRRVARAWPLRCRSPPGAGDRRPAPAPQALLDVGPGHRRARSAPVGCCRRRPTRRTPRCVASSGPRPAAPRCPASVWLRQPAWTAGTASTLVDRLSGSQSAPGRPSRSSSCSRSSG